MLPNANKKEIIKQAREPGKRRKTFFLIEYVSYVYMLILK
jgi:hypothetical protein